MKDLQKAGMWKRISAALLDVILLATVAVGVAFLLSTVLNFDGYEDQLEQCRARYEIDWGLDFDISAEEYQALPEETRALYDQAWEAFAVDPDANHAYGMMMSLALLIVTFGLLVAFLLLEWLVPLLLGNGQTLGKKVFAIAVMRADSVRLSPLLLFVRTVLGKYTVETMVPVLIAIMIAFGSMGIVGIIVIGGLLILQLILLAATRAHTPIHDLLAHTVTVDIQSQRIFDSPEALLEYKKKLHAEAVERGERA